MHKPKSRRSSRQRLFSGWTGAVLAAGLLAGCAGPDTGLQTEAARQLQARVLAVSEASARNDPAAALTALDALETELAAAADSNRISAERRQNITTIAAAVRADLNQAIAAAEAAAAQAAEEARIAAAKAAEQAQIEAAAAAEAAAAEAAAVPAAPPPPVIAPQPEQQPEKDPDKNDNGNKGKDKGDD